jgi:hypothetical protein
LALQLAWALRATGLPVWHDKTDNPPGDIGVRLEEALASGLSGAILLVTPEVEDSEVIRGLELPRLLLLEASDADFSLAIANTVPVDPVSSETTLDYDAPDRLVDLPSGTLRRLHQYRYFEPGDASELAAALAMRRMSLFRRAGPETLEIDIQTRNDPGAYRSSAPLVVRLPPPAGTSRVPTLAAWTAFRPLLGALPGLVEESGATTVMIRGGAHLSAALAIGVALPTTTIWQIQVHGTDGTVWVDRDADEAESVTVEVQQLAPEGHLAVMVDCVPGTAHPTFAALIADLRPQLCASMVVRAGEDHGLAAKSAATTASTIARHIRDEAARQGTTVVHLAMRAPFPFALMLGRRLNTLELVLYEWDSPSGQPRYVPTLTVASGRDSPVVAVSDPHETEEVR